jgi:hypothetical protein
MMKERCELESCMPMKDEITAVFSEAVTEKYMQPYLLL